MNLIKFKILHFWISKKIKNNKTKEAQINLYLWLHPTIEFKLDLSQHDTNIFYFDIDLFGLFKLNINKNKKSDHAGLLFKLSLFGLDFNYSHYDIRHWDYDNDTWEVYE